MLIIQGEGFDSYLKTTELKKYIKKFIGTKILTDKDICSKILQ